MGGGNTPGGVSPHPQGAWLALRLVRQGDGLHYPVGQPLFGDSLPFLLPSVADKELLGASDARVRVTYMRNALTGHSNAKAGSASSEGSACRFTTWSRKGVVGTLGTYQTENDRNQKDTDETASWKRRDRPWFALLEFALSVEVPRGIADERDSADRTVTPTGNKTKMNGFVEISTLLIHSAPKQKSNEWMHLSPFYTRMHGEWLRYAKSTSQFNWRFLLVRDVRGFQVNPLCRHDITRSDRQIGNTTSHLDMTGQLGTEKTTT